MSTKYLYSDQTGPSLPGGGPLFFRTVTIYDQDSAGKVINPRTIVFYTAKPGGRAGNGDAWTPGSSTSFDGFNQGGFVRAATTFDGGRTFSFGIPPTPYTQEDADAGRIPPGKNVGDPILGATAIQSLNTRGGVLNEAIQNSVINAAVNTEPGLAQQLAAKLQNTAPPLNPDQPPNQGGNPSSPPPAPPAPTLPAPQPVDPVLLEVAGGVGSFLKYPKLMKDDQDKIKFTACEIQQRQPTSSNDPLEFSFGKPTYKPVDGAVFLAIQSPISDQNSVDWGPDSVNAIDAAIYNASSSFMNEGDLTNKAKGFLEKLYGTIQQQQPRIRSYLAGQAASINNILARTDNVVLNPNLELLFNGPQLRPFTFQFKMSARNQDEANEIKSIIKYFKYHMAAREEQGKLFLRAPHVFTIQYLKGNISSQPGINVISPNDFQKACALTNCSVDYTPLGSYSTYTDGTMVAYTLSLQFQEITPIYASDYVNYPHPIGF